MSSIKTIVCDFDLGKKFQTIYYCDAEENTVTPIKQVELNELANSIVAICYNYDCHNVHLYGVEEIMEFIAMEVKSHYLAQYGENKIHMELN